MISDCDISLQIFNKEDGSVLEYISNVEQEIVRKDKVSQHVKFTNDNYQLCQHIDRLTVKYGHMLNDIEENSTRMYTELEGYNMF